MSAQFVGYNGLGQFRNCFIDGELPVLQEPEDHLLIIPPVPARREARMLPLQPFFDLQDELHSTWIEANTSKQVTIYVSILSTHPEHTGGCWHLGGGGGGAAAGRSGAAAVHNPSPGETPQGRRSSGDGAEGASCSHRLRFSSLSLSLSLSREALGSSRRRVVSDGARDWGRTGGRRVEQEKLLRCG
jgi:hypothetical protein